MEENKTDYRKRSVRLTVLLTVAVVLIIIMATLFAFIFKELPVIEALAYIRSGFYDYDEQQPEKLTETALAGIARSLDDDYSEYYTEEEYDEMMSGESGEYVGIGVLLAARENGDIEVTAVYSGSSAAAAGIVEGDILVSVNGQDIKGKKLDEVVGLVGDARDSGIRLGFLRNGGPFDAEVSFGKVVVPHAVSEMLTENIGYIRITEFTGNAASETEKCLNELIGKGMKGLVIDLRNNPGGNLDCSLQISELFLKKGDTIVSIRSRQNEEKFFYATKDGMEIPTVILINGGTASASELMTAALHDNGRAYVIGTRSYGKGIVQTIYPLLSNGGRIKFTTEKYFTPAGKCIHGEGIEPDLTVDDANSQTQGKDKPDLCIEAALEHLQNVLG